MRLVYIKSSLCQTGALSMKKCHPKYERDRGKITFLLQLLKSNSFKLDQIGLLGISKNQVRIGLISNYLFLVKLRLDKFSLSIAI